MKRLLIFIFILGLFSTGISQTIEQAETYYKQDSTHKAMVVIKQLDQNDKKVKKLKRQIERRQKQILIEFQNQKRAEGEQLREEAKRKKTEEAKYKRIYGGIPTANRNLKWNENLTPKEKYRGVIHVDSTIAAGKIIEAFIATYQPMQDANIMTKQMRTNNTIGSFAAALNGDSKSIQDFAKSGDADLRMQNQRRTSWTVQFIDGIRLSRFYYNINVQAKDGRYKITVVPSGLSGYAQDHIQTEWNQMFRDGELKPIYSNYYVQMKTKLAFTIDQWINGSMKLKNI